MMNPTSVMAFVVTESTPKPRRAATLPHINTPVKKPELSSDYVTPGRILWLPRSRDIPVGAVRPLRGSHLLEEHEYGCPVILCSRPSENVQKVHFHIVESFGGQSLSQTFNRSKHSLHQRLYYLPLFPSSPHPDHDKIEHLPSLELTHDQELPGNVYVNAREIYAVDWRYLTAYRQSGCRLEPHSLNALLRRSRQLSGYMPGPQVDIVRPRAATVPTAALRAPYRVPVPVDKYPIFFDSNTRLLRGPRLNVMIPGAQGYGSIVAPQQQQRQPTPDPGSQGSEVACLDECVGVVAEGFTEVVRWTGQVLGNAFGRRRRRFDPREDTERYGRYGKIESASMGV